MTMAAVPVIDISPWRSGDPAARRALAAEVDRTCREIGFMVIGGHGVDPDLIAAVESLSRTFFDLPVEEKMKIVRPAPDVTRAALARTPLRVHQDILVTHQMFVDAGGLRSLHAQVKDKPGRTPLFAIKVWKDDPAAVEAQGEEIKRRYAQYFKV